MKNNLYKKLTTGYIEGYYGKLLSWQNRKLIVKSLCKNKMNTYFYAPKEDVNHRLNWKKEYSIVWRTHFRKFTKFSKKNNVDVIAGIAPGLSFDFNCINADTNAIYKSDFILLYNKAKQMLEDGASSVALLLDDIPGNFNLNYNSNMSEGTCHGFLANKLSKNLGENIYFVPRIYADELIHENPDYLNDLSKILNPNINVFYCGKNVVSKKLMINSKIKKLLKNNLIYWDNYYSNDYCPRRLFVGPYINRKKTDNIMINPTGLINTDLLILDIIGDSLNNQNSNSRWLKTIKNHGVPEIFNEIKHFFLKPEFGSDPLPNNFEVKTKYFKVLDFLLWKWKSDLSREWYPFLFGLKHDLQLQKNILTFERVVKTQTSPLSQHLQKNLIKGEIE